jgi:antirestriction protein ArdC
MPNATAIFDELTARLISKIESAEISGDDWSLPWHYSGGALSLPTNAATKKRYQGGNVLLLWATAEDKGYTTGWWATYKQWESLGAQVRKGEKATYGIKWSTVVTRETKNLPPDEQRTRLVPFTFSVFNAAQVDGWEPPQANGPEPIEHAEAFFAKIGAKVITDDHAYYAPLFDYIGIPQVSDFKDAESYYATLGHEHTHWTSHVSRVNRELGKRFGDNAYAAEELVAELGAAFLAAHLGLSTEPRDDHAQYLKYWLAILKADDKALWKAASLAQAATDFLIDAAGENTPVADEEALVSA